MNKTTKERVGLMNDEEDHVGEAFCDGFAVISIIYFVPSESHDLN